jgi:lipopolysaccharide transport system ATP-binding protein
MSDIPRLVLNGVWKEFRLGEHHDTLRDLIPEITRSILRGARRRTKDTIWALQDVSFEVKPGQVLGIIGPNGAGKSTILKLVTGIMRPTRGCIDVGGRVGALIELAAGFHPDLTGRENVFLQGAVMGMSREEITKKFDEIVAFAEMESFIDTPVKRYSSGMNARLGFAIAASMDPDVLLVDEVLAVGDYAFQKKAHERMMEIVQRSVPVIVVSHQLERIASLCDSVILLSGGKIVRSGSALECIETYIGGEHLPGMGLSDCPIKVDEIQTADLEGLSCGASATFVLHCSVLSAALAQAAKVGIRIQSVPSEERLFATNNTACGVTVPTSGAFRLEIVLQLNVGPGLYRAQAAVWDARTRLEWDRGPSFMFQVEKESDGFGRVYLKPRMRILDQ